jgi:hypothetical protein
MTAPARRVDLRQQFRFLRASGIVSYVFLVQSGRKGADLPRLASNLASIRIETGSNGSDG